MRSLTEAERAALDLSADLWNAVLALPQPLLGDDDRNDVRRAIHDIQRIILSRVFNDGDYGVNPKVVK